MFPLSALMILVIGMTAAGVGAPCPKAGERNHGYSRHSIGLCFQDVAAGSRQLEIPAPNGSVLLKVDGDKGRFYENGVPVGDEFTLMRDVEIVWAPDSTAIMLTSSLGAAGPVMVGVGFVHESGGRKTDDLDLMHPVQKDFAAHHPHDPCRNDANVGGLTWLDGSKKAVVVAEVPPSPQCDNGGHFDAYVISIRTRRILARYPMKAAIRRWQTAFGPRLKDDIQLLADR